MFIQSFSAILSFHIIIFICFFKKETIGNTEERQSTYKQNFTEKGCVNEGYHSNDEFISHTKLGVGEYFVASEADARALSV